MMKYLVFTLPNSGIERALVFDQNEKHADVAKMFNTGPNGWKAVRGGFVGFIPGATRNYRRSRAGLHCFGEAFSLGLHSDPDKDTALLLKCLEV